MLSLKLLIDIIISDPIYPDVHSACRSTTNIFWGKGGQCIGLTTSSPSRPIIMKSGSLELLEPSEPLQGCTESLYLKINARLGRKTPLAPEFSFKF
jgi:hypothetical protein